MSVTTQPGNDDGLSDQLLNAIPQARNVLALGCGSGDIGRRYQERYPDARWTNAEIDLDTADLTGIGEGFDAIVVGELLERLRQPERLLEALFARSAADAKLVCSIPNMSHITVIERMLCGDLTYDRQGLLDTQHVRFLSPSSAFKLFLDSGWLPNMTVSIMVSTSNIRLAQGLIASAGTIGIPQETAERNMFTYRMIVDCTKTAPVAPFDAPPFTVISAINRDNQLHANLLHSPGLAEAGAQLLLCRDAKNAAEAFEFGFKQAQTPWIIYAHQDVYFPKGSGHALKRFFASIPAAEFEDTLIGFAGMGLDTAMRANWSGLCIDRTDRFDYPGSERGISLDEFAIAMHRTARHRIDPDLGWHLWATDLCLKAAVNARPMAKIVRIPLFHNSFGEHTVPGELHESAVRLAAKYPTVPVIPTLLGLVTTAGLESGVKERS